MKENQKYLRYLFMLFIFAFANLNLAEERQPQIRQRILHQTKHLLMESPSNLYVPQLIHKTAQKPYLN
jgi:hypothetical protein